MSDIQSFRESVRAFIAEHAPKSLYGARRGRFDGYWGGRKAEPEPDVKRWFEAALERRLIAPTWPQEFGGGGLSRDHVLVWEEELTALALPPPLVGVGLTMIGPTLLDYGTEQQKREHLPRIVRGEVRWAQGYSEPGAGSDLASLSTRAVREGDDFIINGQKIWTTHADKSDFIFALVRTNTQVKKQLGITFILIDMETPGVSTRPIDLISGWSPFCETFFDNVRVSAKNVVGNVDAGWTVAKALLGYERSMIGEAMSSELDGAERTLVARARQALGAAAGPLPDPDLRRNIAELAMDVETFAFAVDRLRQTVQEGHKPGAESSTLKVVGSDLKQRRWELGVRVAGPDGLGWEGPSYDAADLKTTREWLRSRANTIEGGTSEIQLNIIAKQVLGLGGGKP
ncbi:MAG TPA: acyl-CoA dehydrogenase family protein [Polyangiaceae bacterium]|nr:acyl-CoA dehydrogenase family protein [Polyangiaceae bacterium]